MSRALLPRLGEARMGALLAHAALAALAVALLSVFPRAAHAHSPTYAVYSKYEATTDGSRIAFVFALDRAAVLSLLDRDAAHAKVAEENIATYADFFSAYLFGRFEVANDGVACAHPDRLARFFWDPATRRVVAVTSFTCAGALHDLAIRSRLTHDMPVSHELVGDLQHGDALMRNFFRGDDTEAHVALGDLPASGVVEAPHARSRNRFSYVAIPDKVRRYDDLMRAELGGAGGERWGEAADATPWRTLLHFVGEGVRHIFTGYDHVLFIVTLILSVATWRRLAVTVTAFTAAHSVTLAVATLGVVVIPSSIVEPLIAASVLVVALDAAFRPKATTRAPIAFAFGLIHGFGLSGVLRDLGLSGRGLVAPLLGFNVGVEIGQLCIVTPLFALLLVLRRDEARYGRMRSVIAAGVAVVAVLWIVLRVREALAG
jgi:hydrogenase/urease accessory protein HupE